MQDVTHHASPACKDAKGTQIGTGSSEYMKATIILNCQQA